MVIAYFCNHKNQKFDHKSGYALSYPWYRKDVDDFVAPAEAMEAPPAYQAPSKVTDNPLVGKWVGYDYGDSQVPKSTFTTYRDAVGRVVPITFNRVQK